MPREHGILFQDPMVRAILDGSKDVTRRTSNEWEKRRIGELLWVRECWAPGDRPGDKRAVAYRSDGAWGVFDDLDGYPRFVLHGWLRGRAPARVSSTAAPRDLAAFGGRWRPSLLMPRRASRILLEIVELTREPTRSGLLHADVPRASTSPIPLPFVDDEEARREGVADRAAYVALWNKINRATASKPQPDYLWRIAFRPVVLPI